MADRIPMVSTPFVQAAATAEYDATERGRATKPKIPNPLMSNHAAGGNGTGAGYVPGFPISPRASA